MAIFLWAFVFPYRPIRSTLQLLGVLCHLALQVVMAWDRSHYPEKMDTWGWFHESVWLYFGLVSIGWNMGLIHVFWLKAEQK